MTLILARKVLKTRSLSYFGTPGIMIRIRLVLIFRCGLQWPLNRSPAPPMYMDLMSKDKQEQEQQQNKKDPHFRPSERPNENKIIIGILGTYSFGGGGGHTGFGPFPNHESMHARIPANPEKTRWAWRGGGGGGGLIVHLFFLSARPKIICSSIWPEYLGLKRPHGANEILTS